MFLIQAETKILHLYKNFKNFVTKERPLGGLERSKSHFGQQLPFFSVRTAKGHAKYRSLNMHQRRVTVNKIIEQHLSYQDCNKLITNINQISTRN